MSVLKEQITEIHCEANVLLRKRRADALIDRELNAKTDGVVAKNPKRRRPEKDLVCLSVWDDGVRLQESVGAFSD